MERVPCDRRRYAPTLLRQPAVAKLQVADGRRVQVRAIASQDAEAEQSFFSTLSPRSRYRRFLLGARSLPEPTLRALTAVDQCRHGALVAETDEPAPRDERPPIVADARYVWQDQDLSAEFAIAVVDDSQR